MLSLILLVAVSTASAPDVSVADPDNVIRCVREDVTGSLTRTKKVCHTVGQWRAITGVKKSEARRPSQPAGENGTKASTGQ